MPETKAPPPVQKVELPTFEWQPITGCSPISPGCAHCYTMKLAGEQLKDHPSRAGLTSDTARGPVWNGELRFNAAWLFRPMQLKDSHLVFVCSHGDLFHENSRKEWIDPVFAAMEMSPHHIFQVLTKRADGMRQYVNARYANKPAPAHIHFGISAERQIEADQRIPLLLETRATVRYVTFFPLLGPIEVGRFLESGRISYVSVGTEAQRPMQPEWAATIEMDCATAAVPYLFGQRLAGEEAQE